jgi:phospholipase C
MSKSVLVALTIGVTAATLLVDGCGGGNAPPMGTELSPAECTDGVDNDEDGATDCADTGCAAQSFCLAMHDGGMPPNDAFVPPATETNCTNGVDDDVDGATDCADSDCATACRETSCTNGIDDDLDGAIDCRDSDCHADPACQETTAALCHDGVDDDGDGAIDCDDSGCTTFREHRCSGGCVANDVLACGPSCSACTHPANATATCDGTACGFRCNTGFTQCGTGAAATCVDTTSDEAHCGSCTLSCSTGGTCLSGICHGGLFGACASTLDCSAVTTGTCADAAVSGYPMGMCTRACTSNADCGTSGECVTFTGGVHACMPLCTHGSGCREGYNCFPSGMPDGSQICEPLCEHDAECGGGTYCDVWRGFCTTAPVDPTSGAPNGAACGIDPQGATNCLGSCTSAWSADPPGSRSATGYANGQCLSTCDLPAAWTTPSGGPLPASDCPSGSDCIPYYTTAVAGDLGLCLPSCTTDTNCADGYRCRFDASGATWTTGYCDPIDCNDGTHACPGNYWCETGYDTTNPSRGRCHPSRIEHVVLVVQENHSFDSYFGRYCTAPTDTNPTCTTGRTCCEAAPTSLGGVGPGLLTDADNYNGDRNHDYSCEICEMDYPGGFPPALMDRYTTGTCPGAAGVTTYACSTGYNWRVSDGATPTAPLYTYWNYARQGALADRYFHPIAGGTASNDVYLAGARYLFLDNDRIPSASVGRACSLASTPPALNATPGSSVADILVDAGVSFHVYADGYADAAASAPSCPGPFTVGPVCHETVFYEACHYDSSDIPFQYWARFQSSQYMRDYQRDFLSDVTAGTLPDFAYVKFRTSRNEHPGFSWISDGERAVDEVVQAILTSPLYRDNTLILLTWDEGGGFYDHVSPPDFVETFPPGTTHGSVDFSGYSIPYGTRVPLLAIGRFAQANTVSHVTMEHSSIVRFLEWNFLGPSHQGDLGARDLSVNNIGSMLDATAVGVAVP